MFFSRDKTAASTLVVHVADDAIHLSRIAPGEKKIEAYEHASTSISAQGTLPLKELRALLLIQASHREELGQIACVLDSPHALVQARHLVKKFPSPTVITESVFDALLRADRAHIEEHLLAPHAGKLDVISRTLSHIRVNGYETNSFFGKKAEMVEFDMVMGYIDTHSYRALDSLFSELFPGAKISFYARPLLISAEFLSESRHSDALLLDIGAKMAHASLFRGGMLAEHLSVEAGVRLFVESLLHVLHASHAELASLLALHKRGDLAQAEAKRLDAALAKARTAWVSAFEQEWKAVRETQPLPRTLALLAADDTKRLFGSFFSGPEFRKALRESGDFDIVELDALAPQESINLSSLPFAEQYLISGLLKVMHSNAERA